MRFQLVSRAATIGASLLGQVLVTRWLGPEGNGLLASATTVLAVGMLAADLGVNTAASRALARAYYADPRGAARIAGVGLALKLGLTGAVAAAMLLCAAPIAGLLGGGPALAPVIAWAGLQLLLDNLATYSFRGLQGLHRDGPLALAQAVSGVGSPLFSAAIVWAGWGAPGAVVGRAAGAGVAAVWGLAGLVAALRALARLGAPPGAAGAKAAGEAPTTLALLRDLSEFASRIFWVNLAYLVFFRLDQGLVQLMLGTKALGLYNPAAAIGEKCLLPVVSLATVAAPRFAAVDSEPGRGNPSPIPPAEGSPAARERLSALFAQVVRTTTLLYVPAAVGLALLAPDAVRVVFGPAYEGTGPILRAYGAAILLLAHATLLGGILDYMGLARARALAFLAAAAADLSLNTVLLPRLGPVAPVVSLTITFTPLVGFYGFALARRLRASLRAVARDLAGAFAASLAMAAAIHLARPPEGTAGPLRLALLVALGAAVYGGALLALGTVSLPPRARGVLARLGLLLRA